MRTIHLFCDRAENQFVQGINTANPLPEPRIAQDDHLQLIIHSVVRNTATPALTPFVEVPLIFSEVRAAIGYIDARPSGGSFKLRVGTQTTALLAWPADLSTEVAKAAWKLQVLTALQALSSVGSGGVTLVDPPPSVERPNGTPPHFFYFRWTDPARETQIEVVELKLFPWIEPTVKGRFSSGGYTQLVKLAQFPVAMTANFARPMPPEVLIVETNPGGAGKNAEQTIVIPPTAIGSVSFSRDGVSTKTMSVATLTAASLQAALNEIVANGATNPSFRVEARPDRGGKRFAVEFRGPLAGAAQPMLGKAMHDQEALPYAVGTLNLADHLGIEQALNGEKTVRLMFELVVNDDGDETFLREVTLVNDMTAVSTQASAEEQGAIVVFEKTVYVASDDLLPYVEASPGISYVPSEDAESFVIPHNLGTWHPQVRISRKISSLPERWEQMPDDEFTALSTSANSVTVDFDLGSLSDDGLEPNFFGNFKIFVVSPDSRIVTFSHQHDFDGVREHLPDGITLRAKLNAIEAAIGMVGGELDVPASGISGKISPDQIDLDALCKALETSAAFRALLLATISDSAIIDRIALSLKDSAQFLETLKAMLTNSELLKTLIEALAKNSEFASMLRELLIAVLQGGVQLPAGTIPFIFESFERTVPAVHVVAGPTQLVAGSGTTTKEVTSDDERTKLTTVLANTELQASHDRVYERLPIALVAYSTGATIAGRANLTDFAENQIRTASDIVRVRSIGARRGVDYPSGTILGRRNGILFPVRIEGEGPSAWPTEFEHTLFALPKITGDLFSAGSQLIMPWQVHVRLEGGIGGRLDLSIEVGTPSAQATNDLYLYSWAALSLPRVGGLDFAVQELPLGDALGVHSFEIKITRAVNGTMTGELKRWGRVRAFNVPALPFSLRARTRRFDAEDLAGASGALTLRRPSTVASISAL